MNCSGTPKSPPRSSVMDLLQVVLVPSRDAHLVGLDRGLDLELAVLDRLDDLLGLLDRDSLLDLDDLADGAARRRLDLLEVERLDGDPALDEPRLEDVDDGLQLVLVVGGQRQLELLLVPLDLRLRCRGSRSAWRSPWRPAGRRSETSCRSTLLTTSKENSWAMGGFYSAGWPVSASRGSRLRGARDCGRRSVSSRRSACPGGPVTR